MRNSIVSIILTGILSQFCHGNFLFAQSNQEYLLDTIPHYRSIPYRGSSALSDSLVMAWAVKETKTGKEGGKVNIPRIWLSRFHAGYKIDELNKEICNTEP